MSSLQATAEPGRYRTSYLWEVVWQPRKGKARRDPHRAPLIFPRFHQWHAVNVMTDHAARHGSGHNYLVMHSQHMMILVCGG